MGVQVGNLRHVVLVQRGVAANVLMGWGGTGVLAASVLTHNLQRRRHVVHLVLGLGRLLAIRLTGRGQRVIGVHANVLVTAS